MPITIQYLDHFYLVCVMINTVRNKVLLAPKVINNSLESVKNHKHFSDTRYIHWEIVF